MNISDIAKNLFTEQVEVPDATTIKITPIINGPTPSYNLPGTYSQSADQEAIKTLDEKSKIKFEAAINAKNPKYFNKLNDLLSTLAEDMPEAATYKTAIKLLAKEGATTSLLISDLDLCISAIEENNNNFSQSVEKKLKDIVGNHQYEHCSMYSNSITKRTTNSSTSSRNCNHYTSKTK